MATHGPRSNGHLPDPQADLTIAVDFDGVLFDQAAHIRERFERIHGIDIGPVETWPWNLSEHDPVRQAGLTNEDTWQVFHSVHNDPELHEVEPLDADCCRVLETLIEGGHRVEVVTARSHASQANTERFLERNAIPHHALVMDDHEKTGYDVLLDDLPHHVRRVADDGSLGLLMDQPYNRGFQADGNPYRVDGWADVGALLAPGTGR